PFMGSGTTAVAAIRTGRHFVGYDTDPGYVERARERVAVEQARAGRAARHDDGHDEADPTLPTAREVAIEVVKDAGFVEIERDVKLLAGLEVTLAARDHAGRRWLFEVAGGFTSTRPGLRRADVLWRT